MHKTHSYLSALLLGTILICTPACFFEEVDPCKDILCGDQGSCFEGVCFCNTGYETGPTGQCDTESRLKFYGTYTVAQTCTPNSTYTSTIAAGADVTKIIISNFAGVVGQSATATVTNQHFILDPLTSDLYGAIGGSGTISGTTVTLTYSSPDTTFLCKATFTR